LEELEQENAILHKKNAKLKEKLIQCTEGFQQIIEQTDALRAEEIIFKLSAENKYLKDLLEIKCTKGDNNIANKKLKKTKSMNKLESDSDNEDKFNIAVKLLAIKFHFERKKENWRSKRSKHKDKSSKEPFANKYFKSNTSERKRPLGKKIKEKEIEEIIVDIGNSPNKEEEDEVDLEAQRRLSSYSLT